MFSDRKLYGASRSTFSEYYEDNQDWCYIIPFIISTNVPGLTGFVIKASSFVDGKTFSNSDLFISNAVMNASLISGFISNSPCYLKAVHLWHAHISYPNVLADSIISKMLDCKNWIDKAVGVHSFKLKPVL